VNVTLTNKAPVLQYKCSQEPKLLYGAYGNPYTTVNQCSKV